MRPVLPKAWCRVSKICLTVIFHSVSIWPMEVLLSGIGVVPTIRLTPLCVVLTITMRLSVSRDGLRTNISSFVVCWKIICLQENNCLRFPKLFRWLRYLKWSLLRLLLSFPICPRLKRVWIYNRWRLLIRGGERFCIGLLCRSLSKMALRWRSQKYMIGHKFLPMVNCWLVWTVVVVNLSCNCRLWRKERVSTSW